MAAAASAAEGGELQGMYERKLRALTLEAATKRMLDPKLDSTWTQFVTVYLQHRDKVATEMTALISSFEPDAAIAAAKALDAAQAEGSRLPPLLASPFVVADNIETASGVTSAGLAFLDEWEAGVDAPIVAAAQAAGGLLAGKANLAELGFSATGANPAFGTARNPYKKDRVAGGSSGGIAACVAARFAVFGIGIDGRAGGVRVPAALCGVVGFRPSMLRYPGGGCISLSPSRDTPAIVCRSVGDAIMIDAALTGASTAPMHDSVPSPTDLRGVKLARPSGGYWDDLEADVSAEFDRAIEALQKAGAVIVDVDVDPSSMSGVGGGALPAAGGCVEPTALETSTAVCLIVDAREAVTALSEYFWERGARTSILDLVGAVQGSVAQARLYNQLRSDREGFVTAKQAVDANVYGREALRAALRSALEEAGASAFIWPACPCVACTVEEAEADTASGGYDAFMSRNATTAANAEMCSVVVPCGAAGAGAARLPVALEICAPGGQDDELLRLALAVEAVVPKVAAPRGM